MTEKEALELAEKFDLEQFEEWWYNEGSEGPIRNDAETKMDTEEFVYTRCKEAWLNGAFKARQ